MKASRYKQLKDLMSEWMEKQGGSVIGQTEVDEVYIKFSNDLSLDDKEIAKFSAIFEAIRTGESFKK